MAKLMMGAAIAAVLFVGCVGGERSATCVGELCGVDAGSDAGTPDAGQPLVCYGCDVFCISGISGCSGLDRSTCQYGCRPRCANGNPAVCNGGNVACPTPEHDCR